jgi:regulator of protease activity HflC (stomatin/prohibitin superfamily)
MKASLTRCVVSCVSTLVVLVPDSAFRWIQYVASAARDVIGDVSVFDLFQNRSDIKTRLHAEVSAALAPVDVAGFRIGVPRV